MAITLLNVQPKTNRNIEKAYRLLEEIKDEDSSDTYGISAQYFLGRIDQIHRSPPDPESARRHFSRLIERHGEHPAAQLAIIKLGILDLYDPSIKDVATRLSRTEERVEMLMDPMAERDFHILLAEAYERFNFSKSKSLEHLLAAKAADPTIELLDPNFTVGVADLVKELGDLETAIRYYRRFLENYQRDARRFQVARTLETLISIRKSREFSNTE